MAREKTKCITSIGGQALIEGILMRGPKKTEIAVRLSDGSISLEEMNTGFIKDKYPVFRLPLLRGVAAMIDSLTMGYKALSVSVEKAGLEEDEEPSKFDKWVQKTFGDKMMNAIMVASTVLGLLLAVVLFFMLPTFLFNLIRDYVAGPGFAPWRSVVEGIMRIAIFIIYIYFCARMPEIKRLFQYHGAEHKTIFCYENNEELTVENVRRHSRFHPRCGTSFLVIMLLLGIIVGFFIPFGNPFVRTIVKILCIPLIMGIGYEFIRLCGRCENTATRIISAPGLWMQHITTQEPDDSMIEVAIAAMQQVIPENGEDKIKVG
ncbi:DUF1385 domain-containing protein [Caproiciproducens galactitolivorans]|uniref:DUF1385 domain-containing protein n=1 Tax=Caproiciproducens galactitolivorans TaxID=642589 RepID=A0A4Z0Y091_9FIRM|nr:DUF1385 domain-containing protein [Caproiciproducens galactitolivorans]QEY35572.1 DUF1385 domain-containing protein [Caproiciproducens galactitolivorans]TGJ77299.1 hypothetical protein CAGA_06680 [Caproiciproducens galactitolivorans]